MNGRGMFLKEHQQGGNSNSVASAGQTLYELINRGELPTVKIGRRTFIAT